MEHQIIYPEQSSEYVSFVCEGNNRTLTSLDHKNVMGLFKTYGAILFRGFQFDQKSLNDMTSQYCSGFVNNKNAGRQKLPGDDRTQTVNLGEMVFPLHAELSQVPWRPDIAWFICARAPLNGGETTLCDGIALADRLTGISRQSILNRYFLYKSLCTMEECEKWTGIKNPTPTDLRKPENRVPYTFSFENGKLVQSFVTPVLQKPMFSDKLAFCSFLLFSRLMHHARKFPTFEDGTIIPDDLFNEVNSISTDLTVRHQWQQGDILMVDNTRFMHGRSSIENVKERLILTQFGYASFRPELKDLMESQPWRHNPSMLASQNWKR